jgi:hypothetical protein
MVKTMLYGHIIRVIMSEIQSTGIWHDLERLGSC